MRGRLSTLLSGRIRLLQHLRDPAAVTHAPFFGPKVQHGIAGGSCPSRRRGGTQGVGCLWTSGRQDPHGSHIWWEGVAPGRTVPRDQPVGREGQWKLSRWRPFALAYPKSTKREPAESCAHIFSASGRSCPAQGLCFQTQRRSQGLL